MSDFFGSDEPRPTPAPTKPPESGRSRALMITALVLLVGFVGLTVLASFWTERAWFNSVGFGGVFTTLIFTRVGLFAAFGLVMAAVVAVNIVLAYRYRPWFQPDGPDTANLQRYREAVLPIRLWLLAGISGLMAVFAGSSAAGQWRSFALWRNGGDFGQTDPYFNRDVGFYIFDLPWFHYVVDFAMAAAVVGLMAAAVVHYLYGGIRLQSSDRLSPAAQVQFSVLLGVFVLAKAADYWLDRFDLLTNDGQLITGMTYTRENAVLPAKEILLGIALVCAVLFFLNVWRRTWMLPSLGIALLALSSILLGLIWPGIVQQFQVDPSEPDKEDSYIARNIESTRAAYDLEDVAIEPFNSDTSSVAGDFGDLTSATASVPLVDPQIVNRTFEQVQQVRAYYSVADVLDVDRYEIDGTDRALVLGVRELDQSGINEGDLNWTNLHTVYTHGNGVIAAYANQRGQNDAGESNELRWAEGQQVGQDALAELGPDGYEDRVYFGEQSPDYSVVGKTSEDAADVELDLGGAEAQGEDQATTYDGDGGVGVGNLFAKTMFALRFGEPNFLLSGRVHENSQVLYHREPADRVERVAPWLTVDADPYPAVIDGRIVWIMDGYTTSDLYPQSERESFDTMIDDSLADDSAFGTLPTDEINYMRNAVKATVDAYSGEVTLYAWDESDPILQAWRGVFPGVVTDRSEISEELMEHLRYPEDMFKVQRYQFARYHVTDSGDFYRGSDRWEVPEDPYLEGSYQPPYRLFVDDPTVEGGEAWSMTSVYTPFDKDNLASFVSVNSDATSDDYGQIRALELPNEQVDGPGLVANEMANSDNVRRELQAFNLGETKPTFGNLLTLPVGEGLMYVQPVYAVRQLSDSSYPILQFVIVSYNDRVGIGQTFREAIADVLGVDPEQPADPAPEEPGEGDGGEGDGEAPTGTVNEQIRDLLAQAEEKFTEAEDLQRQGDSVGWAESIEEARELVQRAVLLSAEQNGAEG